MVPSLEERINYYESRSSLTADQTIKLNNLELLEQRIKTIHHKNTQENSNPLGGILALGLLSGGGYWGYKRYKKSKQ